MYQRGRAAPAEGWAVPMPSAASAAPDHLPERRGVPPRAAARAVLHLALAVIALAATACVYLRATIDSPADSVRAALGARLADVSASRLADVAALEGAAVEVDRALEAERSARREQRSAADSQASAHRRAEALRAEVDAAQRLRARQMELTARAAVELRSARRSLEEVAAVREGAVATQAASWRHSRTPSNDANVFETEVVSWYPRATLFRNFISAAERAHIEALVSGHLSRSQVVSDDEDKSVDRARTSSGVFLVDRELRDEVVMAIEERIANATHTPRHNGEGMYYLRYEHDQQYEPHTDYCFEFPPEGQEVGSNMATSCLEFMRRGKDRYATFLFYIKAPDQGGETAFALADPSGLPANQDFNSAGPDAPRDLRAFHSMMLPQGPNGGAAADSGSGKRVEHIGKADNKRHANSDYYKDWCERDTVLKVAPNAGDALFFHNFEPHLYPDWRAQHGGCPVKSGEKHIVTRWIRMSNFGD